MAESSNRGTLTRRFGWIWISAGTIWKSAEIIHNLEYLQKAFSEHFDPSAILRFLLEPSPLLLILGGFIWLRSFRPQADRTDLTSTRPRRLEGTDEIVQVIVRRKTVEEVEIEYRRTDTR